MSFLGLRDNLLVKSSKGSLPSAALLYQHPTFIKPSGVSMLISVYHFERQVVLYQEISPLTIIMQAKGLGRGIDVTAFNRFKLIHNLLTWFLVDMTFGFYIKLHSSCGTSHKVLNLIIYGSSLNLSLIQPGPFLSDLQPGTMVSSIVNIDLRNWTKLSEWLNQFILFLHTSLNILRILLETIWCPPRLYHCHYLNLNVQN